MKITIARIRSNVKYNGPLETVLDSFFENYVKWMKANRKQCLKDARELLDDPGLKNFNTQGLDEKDDTRNNQDNFCGNDRLVGKSNK